MSDTAASAAAAPDASVAASAKSATGVRWATYSPAVFSVPTIEAAKQIILTPENGRDTDQRWEEETGWLLQAMQFDDASDLLVDFGCGIGRLASRLPNPVMGVDISPEMRRHAEQYVGRPGFDAISPDMFRHLVRSGLQFDGGYSSWVLQHVLDPDDDIAWIARSLRRGGRFWVLNQFMRWVPTDLGWLSDDKDVAAILARHFSLEREVPLPSSIFSGGCYLRCYRAI